MTTFDTVISILIVTAAIPGISPTIDINFAEFEYLANHLTPEECRRLVAAAHFKTYNEPNALGQAERAIPQDISCLDLLLHWNSAEGEGKGETHEVLEHRLRQMGRFDLADWLGKTVFHQLGEDLEDSLKGGMGDLANDSVNTPAESKWPPMPTLNPPPDTGEIQWLPFDSICLALLCGLSLVIVLLCAYVCSRAVKDNCKRRKKRKQMRDGTVEYYEMVENLSPTDSEEEDDKFDLRDHERKI